MNKMVLFVFAVFLAAYNLIFAQTKEPVENCSLTIGTASGYAPFVSLDERGKYEGFDIDLAGLVAKKLGRSLVVKDLGSMPSLILAVQQGKVDAIIWDIAITKERLSELNLVQYRGKNEETMSFIFWKEVPSDVNTIEDLEKLGNEIISVESGTSQDSILKNFPQLKLKYVDKITDAVMDVKYQKSTAAAVDNSLTGMLTGKEPHLIVKRLPVPAHLQSMGIGIGVAKKNGELTSQIEKAIEELKAEGKVSELELKWNLNK